MQNSLSRLVLPLVSTGLKKKRKIEEPQHLRTMGLNMAKVFL